MANIDRADWHYGGNYPADLPPENGGTHIGMFLSWAVSRELVSTSFKKNAGPLLEKLCARGLTGRAILFEAFDEKFFDGMLTKRGREFVRDYYDTNSYITDYEATLSLTTAGDKRHTEA